MQNTVQKAQENFEQVEQLTVTPKAPEAETAETVVEFVARAKMIAKQSEEACNMDGNTGSADFDAFEEKYGFISFA